MNNNEQNKIRRFYKIDEDENFIEITGKNVAVQTFYKVKPLSSTGCWVQKSTGKHYERGIVIATYLDGSTDEEDYEWIEY